MASVSPVEWCDYVTFPDIHLYLRNPGVYAPIDDSFARLRLVCRAFYNFLGSSPHHFVKGEDDTIPYTTRAIYITVRKKSHGYRRRLLDDPYRSHLIVTLWIACNYSSDSGRLDTFDRLCKSCHALPGLRTLGIRICYSLSTTINIEFWNCLQQAFPLLACLMLGTLTPRSVALMAGDEEHVFVFEQLEILDLGCFVPWGRLRFPALRYLALDHCSQTDIEALANSTRLESLLLRGANRFINIASLSYLRSLGLPSNGLDFEPTLPADHPLRHVRVYLSSPMHKSQNILHWVKRVSRQLPEMSHIWVDLRTLTPVDQRWVQDIFHNVNLLFDGLRVMPFSADSQIIVIKRVELICRPAMGDQPTPTRLICNL